MSERNIDAYIVPTADYHGSEMVGAYFKSREYITGFTGSAGTAVITADDAGLWTDGRYYIQAANELEGSGIKLHKIESGSLSITEWLVENLESGSTVAFDGRTVTAREGYDYEYEFSSHGIHLDGNCDLISLIWDDRPALPDAPAFYLDEKYSGESTNSKLARLRSVMQIVGADAHIITALDDIAWLLNIRGGDIECSPLMLAYAIVYMDMVLIFADEAKLDNVIKTIFKDNNVEVCPYDDFYKTLSEMDSENVLIDSSCVSYATYNTISDTCEVLDDDNPCGLMKLIKNQTELENIRKAHIKDGVAATRFMYWIKSNCGKTQITELSAAQKYHDLRAEQEGFIEDSFEPIIAYGEHAAIIHYSATEETNTTIEPGAMLLTDTGGHYLDGSTDISRTIILGDISDEQKKDYTAVLRANINLARTNFKHGCHGYNLDAIAREPIWARGKDYNHGTGHGVGYLTNIHEGNIGFRIRVLPNDNQLEAGMIITDEPGIYEEGRYGIRTENELLVCSDDVNENGQFMNFETLTLAPIDLDGIIPEAMQPDERAWLNDYHKKVYTTISPYLTDEELIWLKEYTREI